MGKKTSLKTLDKKQQEQAKKRERIKKDKARMKKLYEKKELYDLKEWYTIRSLLGNQWANWFIMAGAR